MDLSRHLRHFIVVAEELHFGHAAEVLGIAQPPLSQSIQRLERELGVELFDRSRRRVELTVAGRLLVGEARELLAREERLRAVMRQVRDGELGTLRVGVPPEIPALTLHALLRRVAEQAPGLSLDLQELTTPEQLRLLAAAQLDAGLVHHPVDAPGLRFGPVVEIPLGVVLPRTSPLARSGSGAISASASVSASVSASASGAREISLADLAGHDLVVFPRETSPAWYDRILEVCRARGFSPARLHHARNPEFLLGLVLAGHGVAFEQEAIARREPRVIWRPLVDRPLCRGLCAAWPKQAAHPAAARFAALAAEILAEGGTAGTPSPSSAPVPAPWSVVYTPPDSPATAFALGLKDIRSGS